MGAKLWSSLPLGDGISYLGELGNLQQRFDERYGTSPPKGAAVFTRIESGALHCQCIAYFSPAARGLAIALAATPCQVPELQGLDQHCGAPFEQGYPAR